MDKQIIEIGSDGFVLKLHRGFLVVENHNVGIKREIPLDNILSLVLCANDTIISADIINTICEQGGNIIFCGKNYVPTSITLPYAGHWRVSEHIEYQLDCSIPLKKNLWKTIVQEKIQNQAKVLAHFCPQNLCVARLKQLSKTVLSNDVQNNEGQAARVYFSALFGDAFIRDRAKSDVNMLLNYSYMVLRAMVARAIVGNGLLAYVGLKHCMKSNQMPLVDDLMEPFRPIVDKIVFELVTKENIQDVVDLTPSIKRQLVKIIEHPMLGEKGKMALNDAVYEYVGTFVKSFKNKKVDVKFPQIIF